LGRKDKYYQLLGIQPTDDKQVIKRAYRKKAFHCHPDRNSSKDAAKVFIELTEAYEILLDDNWSSANFTKRSKGTKTAEEELSERMQRARDRYYQSKMKEKEEEEAYYKSLISGKRGQIFKWFGIACALFSVIWFVDIFFLPEEKNTNIIREFEYTQSYIYLNLEGEECVFKSGDMASVTRNNTIQSFHSTLFNDLKYVYVTDHYRGMIKVVPRLSFIYYFPFINILFLIPILLFIFKRPTPFFTLFYLISKYMISVLFIIAIFSRFRLFQVFV